MDEEKREKIKIDLIVIGNPNSGKTSLIQRFIHGQQSFSHFYTPTLGLNLQKKLIRLDQKDVCVCIWDTAGQEKFFALTKNYFKKADGVLILFDLTDKNSFDRIDKYWIHEVMEKSDETCSQILIGNKLDMNQQRVISHGTASQLAEKLQLPYFETSAKTGDNVEKAIEWLVKQCLQKVELSTPSNIQIANVRSAQNSGCLSSPKRWLKSLFNKESE